MNCKKARELFLTDFIDMQLKIGPHKHLQEHLDSCHKCRLFYESLLKKAVEPFKNIEQITPPDFIWERIKEQLQTEERKQQASAFDYLRSFLQLVFNIPKPVFATMAVTVFVLAVTTTVVLSFHSRIGLNNYFEEQNAFLNNLDYNSTGILADNYLGTESILQE